MSRSAGLTVCVAATVLAAVCLPGAEVLAPQPAGAPPPAAAYRVIELPSGRVIGEARPDILTTPVAPGSLMKLATLVALVEGGQEPDHLRLVCSRDAVVDGRTVPCVHPDLHRPLSAAEALGYSCNAFFAAVSRRLSRPGLDSVIIRLGLPPLPAGTPLQTAALGLGGVRATPAQWLEAFLRLFGVSRREVSIPAAARRTLREGAERAAREGTAIALADAGFSALAKTGTAPMPGGGFEGIVVAIVNTELPTHAIVAVVPGASGAGAAAIAAQVLARHGAPRRARRVRMGIARRGGGHDVRVMDVEEYVSRVVAGEMGAAVPAALEAMAITARTFLESNRGRHAAEGFDVCDLTHCQVLGRPDAASDAAARATAGLLLLDRGAPAQVYFSSWCGGHTEKPSHTWPGARDAAYLPAQPDSACLDGAAWTSEIVEADLRRVLEASGLRGGRISGFGVATRHPSGRVELLGVEGMSPGRLSAATFQSAAGRLLGWQSVKGTLFEVRRSSTGYTLTGRGAGHGVGLCVRGAGNRGRAGGSRDQILAAYFPGLVVGSIRLAPATVRITLPESERRHLGEVRSLASGVSREIARTLGLPEPDELDIVFHPTIEAYTRATGQPWYTAGRTSGARIDLLPFTVLSPRGILESTLRHEFTHALADESLAGRPLWVREGLAVYLAGELPADSQGDLAGRSKPCPSDAAFRAPPASEESLRRIYEDAGRCVARALGAGVRWQDVR